MGLVYHRRKTRSTPLARGGKIFPRTGIFLPAEKILLGAFGCQADGAGRALFFPDAFSEKSRLIKRGCPEPRFSVSPPGKKPQVSRRAYRLLLFPLGQPSGQRGPARTSPTAEPGGLRQRPRHGERFFLASGLWTSAAGAAAQAQQVELIANNLANADTNGFKKDLPTFKEYLANVERDHPVDIPRGGIKDRDLYPLDGRDQSYVLIDGTYTNFKQGNLKVTQSPLDVALDGPGFIEVSTPSGIRYTRQGSLKVATDGRLVTNEGFPVLATQPGGLAPAQVQPGQGGPATQGGVTVGRNPAAEAARFINLRDRGQITITEGGEIYAGEDLVAKLSVAEFQDVRKLRKTGGHLFENWDPANLIAAGGASPARKTLVRQGIIETSNVNPVEEMTNLIQANRLFEHDLKALKTYGEMLGREANDIGKL
jgi:flagellar basal-body rod protein FlgF